MCSGMGLEVALQRVHIPDTTSTKLKFRSRRFKSWSDKSRMGTRVQRVLHLLDKMLVATASWVERRERMWVRIESG